MVIFVWQIIAFKQYKGKIYPHVSAMGTGLGSLDKEQAAKDIEKRAGEIETRPIKLIKGERVTEATLSDLGITLDRNRILNSAYGAGKNEGFWGNLLAFFENAVWGYEVPTYFYVNDSKVNEFIALRLETSSQIPLSSKLIYRDGKFIQTPSRDGKGLDPVLFASKIIDYINNPGIEEITLPDEIEKKPEVEEFQTLEARIMANEILESENMLLAGNKSWEIDSDTVANFISFRKTPHLGFQQIQPDPLTDDIFSFTYYALSGIVPQKIAGGYELKVEMDKQEIKNYLLTIAPGVEQPWINARLGFENGQLVILEESQDKIGLDTEKSIDVLSSGLMEKKDQIELLIYRENAPISKDSIVNLGIETLIGAGTSNFSGSPRNRRHNIATGAGKFNGAIIKPGEVFSFLDALGPVDASTGYLPELVIKNDKTIPEYGGGMCQVSTTSFRAAVNAGLEVIERRNHAYPVQYYSPQGTDATVYIPSPDLKFLNNTPAHILVQTKIEGNILTFEYYGASDGRKVETIGPVTYDRKPDGSMRAKWTQKVYRNDGSLLFEKVFLSKYDSPSKYPHPGEEQDEEKKKKDKKKKKKN